MSFDRRVTPFRPDLADERLRGQVEAERFATGTPMRVVASSAPMRRNPSRDTALDTEAILPAQERIPRIELRHLLVFILRCRIIGCLSIGGGQHDRPDDRLPAPAPRIRC